MTIEDNLSPDHDRTDTHLTESLDCGDGVPALTLERPADRPRPFPADDLRRPHVTARVFAIAATALGQLLIAISVAVGGSALIGVMAALTLLVCGLGIVATDALNPRD
jgi:hypothetical protein